MGEINVVVVVFIIIVIFVIIDVCVCEFFFRVAFAQNPVLG